MNRQYEEILRDSFCDYRHGELGIIAQTEVPVFTRSVDLVEYNVNTGKLTAIEFKINDWKRAIAQLKNVEICFDYLVLCIPKPKTQKSMENIVNACTQDGIGLFLWDDSNNTFLHECIEKPRQEIWEITKKHIIDYVSKMEAHDE